MTVMTPFMAFMRDHGSGSDDDDSGHLALFLYEYS